MHDAFLEAVITLLQTISAKLDALPRALVAAERERSVALSKTDRAALETLAPAIAAAVGSITYVWTARELVALAVARAIKADSALLLAIESASGPIDGGTARRIGRLLRRADGITLAGHRIDRVGDARDGALWIVRV